MHNHSFNGGWMIAPQRFKCALTLHCFLLATRWLPKPQEEFHVMTPWLPGGRVATGQEYWFSNPHLPFTGPATEFLFYILISTMRIIGSSWGLNKLIICTVLRIVLETHSKCHINICLHKIHSWKELHQRRGEVRT